MKPELADHIAIDRRKVGELFNQILATSARSNADVVSIINDGPFGEDQLHFIARLHMMGKDVLLTNSREKVATDAVWLDAPIL